MKREPKSRSAGGRVLIALVLLKCSCDASSQSVAATPPSRGSRLSFPERVTYQYAIEEVRWRHRIWPKDNPGPKPPLDAVISREEVEKKVTAYLDKSQALADYWQQPITAEQVQVEMERMASHTRQPHVLRELFAALGNDSFVVAECLARPVLADRLINELASGAQNSSLRVKSRNPAAMPDGNSTGSFDFAQDDTQYKLPEISPLDCADNAWTDTSTVNAPDVRAFHTAVWTGSEMIIWGGQNHVGILNTGGKYDPAADAWTLTSTVNAPTGRLYHSAVWTGSEIIVWGGQSPSLLNTGGRYNPVSDSWAATNIINAPTARILHTAVWTGSEMIVWGGANDTTKLNTGARYDPGTDTWTATSTANAPTARFGHTALWAGSEMIIWGGSDFMNYLHTGGKYNPTTDSWTPTGLMNVAPGRVAHTAIWTGSEMTVWGGVDETFNDTNTGGRYDPSRDSWIATSLSNAPSPRDYHTAVFTGSEMIIWGGEFCCGDLNTGGRYDLGTDRWIATSIVNAPSIRFHHTAIWTGSGMVAWGGFHAPNTYLNTGGIYCAQPSTPVLESAISRKAHGSAGSFDLALPLNGTAGIECRSSGATNDYTIVLTFLANVSVTGSPQAAVTSGIGTIGSGGVSNGGRVTISGNIVTIPLTNVANAQTINVTLYGVNSSNNFVVPMSILIGDTNANLRVNASDVAQTKARIGQQIDGTNFRSDVNANGYIDAADIALVKSSLGTGLR